MWEEKQLAQLLQMELWQVLRLRPRGYHQQEGSSPQDPLLQGQDSPAQPPLL